jgi:nucleoid-associated protein YgaU
MEAGAMFNRETKIFLILGFVLFLGVSVLLVDHFSGTSRQSPAGPLDLDPLLSNGLIVSVKPESRAEPPVGGTIHGTVIESLDRVAKAGGELLNGASQQLDALRENNRPAVAAGLVGGSAEPEASRSGATQPEPASRRPDFPDQLEMGKPLVADPNGGLVQSDEIKIHRVAAGDTLWRIAETYYGDPTLHKALAEFNKDRLTSDGQPRAGATIRIPPRALLLNAPESDRVIVTTPPTRRNPPSPESKPGKDTKDSKEVVKKDSKNDKAGARTYVVQRGDTLSQIAARELGSARRQKEILELNADILKDPDSLLVGMKLKLPAR